MLVAELGVNWRNRIELMEMILLAYWNHCDAIKVQVFDEEHIKGHPREDELVEKILSRAEIVDIARATHRMGLKFIVTPFSCEALDKIVPTADCIKIRYADRYNEPLLNMVKYVRKPLFVSCDEAYLTAQPKAVADHFNKVLMFCQPEYPPTEQVYPDGLGTDFLGYSNHHPSTLPPLLALIRGCLVVEVHVKKEGYPGGYVPIDAAVSLTFYEVSRVFTAWMEHRHREFCQRNHLPLPPITGRIII